MKIPFSPPDIGEDEINEVVDTLKSGWITTGPKTKKFENMLTEYCNSNKTVCLNSATASLEMTLRMLGIGEGDEVIVPAYTYTASASVICHTGAKPVLVDCAENSIEPDYNRLENLINEKTKAIIPVDVGGVPCDYDKIFEAVKSKEPVFQPSNKLQDIFNRVIVLADASHSLGARRNGVMSGALADFSAFSFHAVKNLTTAEGGAVTWRNRNDIDSDMIYKNYMLLSLHGQSKDALTKTELGSWEYDIVAPYFKCNMTDIMASIGIAQLKRYDKILERRKEIVEFYDRELSEQNVSVLNHFSEKDGIKSSAHLYLVRLNGKDERYRNSVIEKMAEYGIATNVHYKPLPMLTAYKNLGFDISSFPHAYNMYKNEITLPLYSTLTDEQAKYVTDCFKKCISD